MYLLRHQLVHCLAWGARSLCKVHLTLQAGDWATIQVALNTMMSCECIGWLGDAGGAATDLPLLSIMDVTLGTHSGQLRDGWMKHSDDTCLKEQMQQGLAGLKSQGCDDRGGFYQGLLGDSPTLCIQFLWPARECKESLGIDVFCGLD